METSGEGFFEITREVARFLGQIGARDGAVLIYLQAHLGVADDPGERRSRRTHRSGHGASPAVAPADAGWVHEVEGPDDMPAHVKSMLNGVSLQVPVSAGELALGTWQGIYVAEHRTTAASARSGSAILRIVRQALRACH